MGIIGPAYSAPPPERGEVGAPAPGGGPCESSQFICGFLDFFQDAVEIFGDIIVPESKLSHATATQPNGSPRIVRFLILICVLAAVELDGKA
jgi:hypothetical protein